jgi:futalosine hydrolase
MARLLIVTAAVAERDAVLAGRRPAIGMVDGIEVHRATTPAGLLDVIAAGVGPVAASVATGCALRSGYDLVISAGIAGGFPAAELAAVVVADAVVHADLGAETVDGFSSMAELGWGPVRFELDDALCAELARRTRGIRGSVLSVSTVTGTQARADELHTAYPDAVAEAMEGIGAYAAATQAGVPFAEIRTISNRVGPRRRDEWLITEALGALTSAFDAALAEPLTAKAMR